MKSKSTISFDWMKRKAIGFSSMRACISRCFPISHSPKTVDGCEEMFCAACVANVGPDQLSMFVSECWWRTEFLLRLSGGTRMYCGTRTRSVKISIYGSLYTLKRPQRRWQQPRNKETINLNRTCPPRGRPIDPTYNFVLISTDHTSYFTIETKLDKAYGRKQCQLLHNRHPSAIFCFFFSALILYMNFWPSM